MSACLSTRSNTRVHPYTAVRKDYGDGDLPTFPHPTLSLVEYCVNGYIRQVCDIDAGYLVADELYKLCGEYLSGTILGVSFLVVFFDPRQLTYEPKVYGFAKLNNDHEFTFRDWMNTVGTRHDFSGHQLFPFVINKDGEPVLYRHPDFEEVLLDSLGRPFSVTRSADLDDVILYQDALEAFNFTLRANGNAHQAQHHPLMTLYAVHGPKFDFSTSYVTVLMTLNHCGDASLGFPLLIPYSRPSPNCRENTLYNMVVRALSGFLIQPNESVDENEFVMQYYLKGRVLWNLDGRNRTKINLTQVLHVRVIWKHWPLVQYKFMYRNGLNHVRDITAQCARGSCNCFIETKKIRRKSKW